MDGIWSQCTSWNGLRSRAADSSKEQRLSYNNKLESEERSGPIQEDDPHFLARLAKNIEEGKEIERQLQQGKKKRLSKKQKNKLEGAN